MDIFNEMFHLCGLSPFSSMFALYIVMCSFTTKCISFSYFGISCTCGHGV